jgi:two-component system cell cycle sensor histidine kinase/response regulator CckA
MNHYRLSELLDLSAVQRMADANYKASGMPIGIIDGFDGSILVGVGWQDICVKFHRANHKSLERCQASDNYIKDHLAKGEACQYKCKNGLWDIGIPIIAAEQHLATMFLGQFFYEGEIPDREFFKQQAGRFGYDLENYLAALDHVPVFTRERVDNILEHNTSLVDFLVDLAEHSISKTKMGKALVESEGKYRRLTENARDVIYRMSLPDGRYEYVNQASSDLFGYTPEEFYGSPALIKQIIHPDWRPYLKEKWEKLLRGEVSPTYEYQIIHKSGQARWLSQRNALITDEHGAPVAIEGIVTDITDRKRSEEALKASEAHLRTLIRTIPDLVWLKDENGVYLSCNSRFESFFGAKEKDIIGKTDYDFLSTELADFFRNHDKAAIEKGRSQKNEKEVVFADDGHHEILETIQTPMHSSRGKLVGVLGIGRDITERMVAEQERGLLIAAIEQADEMITITDRNKIIQYVNPAFERMTGYSHREVIGQTPRLLDSDNPEEAFFQKSWETLSSGRSLAERAIQKHKDGTCFTVDASISPIRDASGQIVNYVSVKRNITDQLQLEAQFRQAQKMESVGRLAGGIAHDYNNMLNVILGNAELATRKIPSDDPLQSHLRAILDAGHRSAAITRQLLAFARKQTIEPRALDLNEVVEGMLKMIRRLIGEQIDLSWIPEADPWPVKMDPSQIDQILVNLCVNAKDAIADLGNIIIETGKVTFDETYCTSHAGFLPGMFVLLAVSDNGCGMERETLDNLFEPFFTTKKTGRGSGLGMATVYGIVKQNGGFINVYSETGKGTTIKIYLPRHEGKTDAVEAQDALEPPFSHGETVLLVEDETVMMEVVRVMLESLDYKVLTAATPSEALSLCEQNADPIDLLITDVVMPQMNGRELAGQLNTQFPAVKTLFMSGYTSNVIAHQGVLDEGVHFIQKPFSMHDLAFKLRKVLDTIQT